MGSLLAATASFLDARSQGVGWYLRIDDIDEPRVVQGAADSIVRTLAAHGFYWDGAIVLQSQRLARYEAALGTLTATDSLFYCSCSRRQLRGIPVYPGTCRHRREPAADTALRIAVGDAKVEFADRIQGFQQANLGETVGDFIVKRRDSLIAYQLATAVDDGCSEITDVVRGADLLDNTARQLYLMKALSLSPPRYAHVPMLVNTAGQKLSKQHHALPVDDALAGENLHNTLRLLGQNPPAESSVWPSDDILRWGIANWRIDAVPATMTLPAP